MTHPTPRQFAEKLFEAIEANDEVLCLALLDEAAKIETNYEAGKSFLEAVFHTRDNHKNTPLLSACWKNLEKVALEMIKKGAPLIGSDDTAALELACLYGWSQGALAILQHQNYVLHTKVIEFESIAKSPYVRDMLRPMISHVLMPLLFCHPKGDGQSFLDEHTHQLVSRSMLQRLFFVLCPTPTYEKDKNGELTESFKAGFLRPKRLADTWHHPPIKFPKDLVPLEGMREWKPLFKEPIDLGHGLWLHCLNKSEHLIEETRQLDHCVGKTGYDQICCTPEGDMSTHILSIRDHHDPEKAHSLSTLEIKLLSSDPKTIRVEQHKAYKNAEPPLRILQAWNDCLAQWRKGKAHFATEPWGQTDDNKKELAKYSPLETICGYENPTYAKINACFDVYRSDRRRESVGEAPNRHLIYTPRTEDGYNLGHLIAGFALVDAKGKPVLDKSRNPKASIALYSHELPSPDTFKGERIVDLRTLDAASWMRATGLMEQGREMIRTALRNDRKTLKAVGVIWKEQDAELDRHPLTTRPIPQKSRQEDESQAPTTHVIGGDKVLGSLSGANANARDPFAPFHGKTSAR